MDEWIGGLRIVLNWMSGWTSSWIEFKSNNGLIDGVDYKKNSWIGWIDCQKEDLKVELMNGLMDSEISGLFMD